jgi:hypothetical protein
MRNGLLATLSALCLLAPPAAAAEREWSGPSVDFSHGRLEVSPDRRFLVHRDGTPFFYLGDTAWELFHRASREEATRYLENRRRKGFTVIQAVALAEFDGLTVPNAYGQRPLLDNDPARPNERYFEHVDFVVDTAADKGLFVGILPTWGDKVGPLMKWGKGPVVFTKENARQYGRYLGTRYRGRPNVIWILGGDRNPDGREEVWRAMAAGIAEGDGGNHLMTYHPMGASSSSKWFHGDEWLDFNMLQSGHAERDLDNGAMVAADYALTPAKPCMDGEPRYEDHPINWDPKNGWFDDYDVRQAAYWALFAGAHGHTYGCHDIWQLFAPGREPVSSARTPWTKALDLPGAWDMLHVRRLLESRPFLVRVPDQSIVVEGQGAGADLVRACRGSDGSYAFVYVPTGKPVTVALDKISGKRVAAYWYDPRAGTASRIGEYANEGARQFTPPAGGRGNDWVLVLDDAARKFPAPGARPAARRGAD